jgi:hypothetical protein
VTYPRQIRIEVTRKGFMDYQFHGPNYQADIPAALQWEYETGKHGAMGGYSLDQTIHSALMPHGPGASYTYSDGFKAPIRYRHG